MSFASGIGGSASAIDPRVILCYVIALLYLKFEAIQFLFTWSSKPRTAVSPSDPSEVTLPVMPGNGRGRLHAYYNGHAVVLLKEIKEVKALSEIRN